MADKALRGINFPGLEGTYFVPVIDAELKTPGAAADAAVTGAALSKIGDLSSLTTTSTESLVSAINELVTTAGENPDWNQNDPAAPDYIKNKPDISTPVRTLLWENAAPRSPFAATTIGLPDMSQYDGVEIVYTMAEYLASVEKNATTGEGYMSSGFIPIKAGENHILLEQSCITNYNGGLYEVVGHRNVTLVVGETSSIEFGTGAHAENFGDPGFIDQWCVPVCVYGIKSGQVASCGSGTTTPLLLNADSAEIYLNDSSYGDEALDAIKTGRQILVRVPNADGGSYTAIYSPIMMYQVPNYQNKYLYLFFLRDEKQDLSALLGQPDGTVQMPTYGQLKMLLSQEYNSDPLANS